MWRAAGRREASKPVHAPDVCCVSAVDCVSLVWVDMPIAAATIAVAAVANEDDRFVDVSFQNGFLAMSNNLFPQKKRGEGEMLDRD